MTTRKEFFSRLEPFHSPSDLLTIELAYTLAKFSHRAQVRKETDAEGKPIRYFEHVRRVTLILIDEAKVLDKDIIVSALLHDGLEDTRDVTPAMLEHVFGKEVTRIVKTLSKVPKEGYIDRFYQCRDFRPYLIKMADRLDNLRSLHQASIEFQAKQIKETRETYYSLFSRGLGRVPEGDRYLYFAYSQLQGQIVDSVEECEKNLAGA